MNGVAAVILAAGGSTRMGQPKPLLMWRGQSLLRRSVAIASEAGCDPVVVVLGAAVERLRPELDGVRARVAVNPDWEQGPGTSIRAGLAVVGPAEAVVFLACDQPLVDALDVRRLIEAQRASGQSMAASGYGDSVGVPALFARECFPDLCALPAVAGAKQLLARRPDAVVVIPFPGGAIDFDTPEDYERFIMEQSHGHGQ